jgi:hypothetical protein
MSKSWKEKDIEAKKLFFIILILFGGIILSLLTYSLAGYVIWGLGSRSRTTMSISLWLPVIFIISFYLIYQKQERNQKLSTRG